MDRVHMVLLGLPLFLFCSDLLNLFTPPPPKPQSPSHDYQYHHTEVKRVQAPILQQSQPDLSAPINNKKAVGYGTTVTISFCTSCSYRGNAITMKKMLENYFPGINVVLSNYPPPLPKRVLSKAVPFVLAGVVGITMAGERVFPILGYRTPPQWYLYLRDNRFGTIASAWILSNMAQSFLQSSGAFEVYCNGDLVFSKLQELRFPGELELKDHIAQRLQTSSLGDDIGNYWSQ